MSCAFFVIVCLWFRIAVSVQYVYGIC